MTTDIQISKLLKSEGVKNFKGVFLYDEIEKIYNPAGNVYVINYVTTEESEEGKVGHFVVVDCREHIIKGHDGWTAGYFMDSYGFDLDEARDIMFPDKVNPHNIRKLFERSRQAFTRNTFDYQTLAKFDSLCGYYSTVYVLNPNMNTNPAFNRQVNRLKYDKKSQELMRRLGFIRLPEGDFIHT